MDSMLQRMKFEVSELVNSNWKFRLGCNNYCRPLVRFRAGNEGFLISTKLANCPVMCNYLRAVSLKPVKDMDVCEAETKEQRSTVKEKEGLSIDCYNYINTKLTNSMGLRTTREATNYVVT
jgi:hypothetical protein